MAFDGYFISKLIIEIKPKVINKRIDRIFSNDDFLVFKFGKKFLNFTINKTSGLLYLTDNNIVKGDTDFSLLLKKHLLNYKLSDIKQLNKDRIIFFEFEGIDLIAGYVKKTLILESFGRNFNIILTENKIIINALKLVHNLEGKTILQNVLYEPLSNNQLPLDYNLIKEMNAKDISVNFEGISPLLASYLTDNNTNLNELSITPTKNDISNQFYWFNLFDTTEITTYQSLSLLLQDLKQTKKSNKSRSEKFIRNEIIKTKKLIHNLEGDLEKNQANFKLKEVADNIYSSGLDLELKVTNFDNTSLDSTLTLNQNAQKLYSLYKKAKASFEKIEGELQKAHDKLEQFQDFKETLEYIDESDLNEFNFLLQEHGFKYIKPKKKKDDAPTIMKIDYKGAAIYVGKNSKQNEYLVTKIAKNDDLWLHVKAGAGSHVVVKGEINSDIIEQAAKYASFYSSYKHSSQIPIDYTLIRYVSKVRKSKTFKVTYTNYKTIYISEINQSLLLK